MPEQQLKGGQKARLKARIPEGEVVRQRFDPETGARELLLRWDGPEGTLERWFPEGELEPVEG